METDTLEATPTLLPVDRCDRCPGQAYVRATFASGSCLQFCGHHGREAMVRLHELGASILDETRFLK